MSDLIQKIQAAQIHAGELAVVQDLHEKGICDKDICEICYKEKEALAQQDLMRSHVRFHWILNNPTTARLLLSLLSEGKGTKEDLENMIDRIVEYERNAKIRKENSNEG